MKVIEFRKEEKILVILDQKKLPEKEEYIICKDLECVEKAIKELSIRGAPALGVASALALALIAEKNKEKSNRELLKILKKAGERIKRTRPTAVNLFHAVARVMNRAEKSENVYEDVLDEAFRIKEESERSDFLIAENGEKIIENGDIILTHCNTGALATSGYGTALGVIKRAHEKGKKIKVFATETRPLLQGARLTTYELVKSGIDITLICDSAAGFFMEKGEISRIIVGADRIAKNGDTANKIGTYMLAVLAKENNVPFYIAAPTATIDSEIESGEEIKIEFRSKEEIEFFNNKRIVARGAKIINPAFDITPARYITAFITEKGILKPPFVF